MSIPGQNGAPPTVIPNPLTDPSQQRQLLPLLLDKLTTVRDTELPARVNVNTAPPEVLAALPGITEADIQLIMNSRPGNVNADLSDPIYQTPAWLITEASFPVARLQSLERYITAHTQVYRFQVVTRFDGGGPSTRIEAVIDTNGGRPRVLFLRDLTELGKGFALPPLP